MMKTTHQRSTIVCCLAVWLFLFNYHLSAQSKLDSRISIRARQMVLSSLLDTIGKRNNFYFSYSNDHVSVDSLVSLHVTNMPLRSVLDTLFRNKIDYKESPGYVILRPAPNNMTLQAEGDIGKDQNYYITGYVMDERTKLAVPKASVYEKRLLVSTLTDENGFFRLRLKSTGMVTLTVSKELYKDAVINFLSSVTVSLQPEQAGYDKELDHSKAERSWLGRIFISSGQKIQTLNLAGYFTEVPFQTSLTPGLSTQGMMSGQVINHFSLNAIGGYTAGLDGVELGGLFNISKKDVRFLQMAGLFNMVGRNFSGLQMAGLGNTVLNQAIGLQLAGVYNQVKDTLTGVQLAGVLNYNHRSSKGVRLAGIGNITAGTSKGTQIAAVFNYARVMNGFAFSLVNVADSLNGYAFGLLNLSRNGYHQIMAYSTEITPVNIGFKSGNAKLYTVLFAGVKPGSNNYFSTGLGIGHDFILSKHYYLSAEASSQLLMAKRWKDQHQVNRLNLLVNYRTRRKAAIYGGPSFNFYHPDCSSALAEQEEITGHKPALMDIGRSKAWIGWTAGFSFL
jgi:hypothetical protein